MGQEVDPSLRRSWRLPMLRRFLDGSLPFRVRWLTFLALAWIIVAGTLAFNGASWAQEGPVAPAAPAAAPPAPARAPAPAAPTPAQQNLLEFYYDSLGP